MKNGSPTRAPTETSTPSLEGMPIRRNDRRRLSTSCQQLRLRDNGTLILSRADTGYQRYRRPRRNAPAAAARVAMRFGDACRDRVQSKRLTAIGLSSGARPPQVQLACSPAPPSRDDSRAGRPCSANWRLAQGGVLAEMVHDRIRRSARRRSSTAAGGPQPTDSAAGRVIGPRRRSRWGWRARSTLTRNGGGPCWARATSVPPVEA